jgi:hypothetical protein
MMLNILDAPQLENRREWLRQSRGVGGRRRTPSILPVRIYYRI